MAFRIEGLSPEPFRAFYGLDDETLGARGVFRRRADYRPGFPCRVTLEDAAPGESVLLLHHESHAAPTPYRSAYAIFVREGAAEKAVYLDDTPPILRGRPLAFRLFDAAGMLVGARLVLDGAVREAILQSFDEARVAYIDAHNAAHGCFAARIGRA